MKKLSIFLAVTIACCVALMAAGCSNLITPADNISSPNDAGIVQVNIGDSARTLLPSAAGLYYTLAFTAPEKTPVYETLDLTAGGSPSKSVTLIPGTWVLEVKAYLTETAAANPADAVASGSVTGIVVNYDVTTPVQVNLSGITGTGTGSLNYTISFPSTVSAATLLYGVIGGTVTEVNLLTAGVTTAGVTTASRTVALSSGYYQIAVYLTDGTTEAAKSELAHIYTGQDTPVDYTFAADDFTVIQKYTISGTITGSDTGLGVDGATVQLLKNGAAQGSPASTAADGTYTIPGVPAGTYTIAVSKGGYTPAAIPAFTVIYANVTGKDLTLPMVPLAFTDANIAGLAAAIAGASGGTISANPIVVSIAITDASLLEGDNGYGTDPLAVLFDAMGSKYVAYDLSGSTFIGIGDTPYYATYGRANTSQLTSITLPATLTSIGDYAFYDCYNLTSVYLLRDTAPLTTLGSDVFYGAYNLSAIYVPGSVVGDYRSESSWSTYVNSIAVDGPRTLSAGVWMDGSVPATDYYRFSVTADKTYAVNIQRSGDQAGSTYTASVIQASAYWEDNTSSYLITESELYSSSNKWYITPQTFTPLRSGNIIIRVWSPSYTGTYAVMVQEAPIFYTVSANGSSSTWTSSQLTLTFDQPVTGLTLNEITVSGGAVKSGAALTGSGTTWYVPITVTNASIGEYDASVAISHAGIHAAAHSVPVYKAFANYTLSANGTSGVTTSTQLTLTFDEPVTGLTYSEITVSGAASKSGASLTGSGTTWALPITVTSPGTAYVTVSHTGVNADEHLVSVHSDSGPTLTSYTVSANGTSGVTTSTQLTLTFVDPVTSLTWSEITVSGNATKSGAALTGSGTTWFLPITTAHQGTASVYVSHTGINATAHTVTVYHTERTPSSTWLSGTIYAGYTNTYRFYVTAGTYYIQWNDSYQGDGTKSCDIKVSGSGAGITSFSNIDSAYNTPRTVTATSSGYITLTVAGYSTTSSGTFAIRLY